MKKEQLWIIISIVIVLILGFLIVASINKKGPALSPADQTGSLAITSTPSGADIYVDGSYRGSTPATFSSLNAADYTIKISKTGYRDYVLSKSVNAGSNSVDAILTAG